LRQSVALSLARRLLGGDKGDLMSNQWRDDREWLKGDTHEPQITDRFRPWP
jgi:hypothetical protein